MGPSYQEVGDVRDTLLNMALWFQILLLVSHARTVKCLSLLASSPLRPTALFCSAPPSPWLCPPLAVKFEGAGASGSSSAKQGSWPCKLMYGTIETHYDLFLLPSLYQLGPFGSQTEDSTQNGLGKMRMCCSSTISHQQKKKKKKIQEQIWQWEFPQNWVPLRHLAFPLVLSPFANSLDDPFPWWQDGHGPYSHPFLLQIQQSKRPWIYFWTIFSLTQIWSALTPETLQAEAYEVWFARLGPRPPSELEVK